MLWQDAVSYKPAPFAVGFTLEGLNAFTVDENGSETFVTHNPLDLLRKVRPSCLPFLAAAGGALGCGS